MAFKLFSNPTSVFCQYLHFCGSEWGVVAIGMRWCRRVSFNWKERNMFNSSSSFNWIEKKTRCPFYVFHDLDPIFNLFKFTKRISRIFGTRLFRYVVFEILRFLRTYPTKMISPPCMLKSFCRAKVKTNGFWDRWHFQQPEIIWTSQFLILQSIRQNWIWLVPREAEQCYLHFGKPCLQYFSMNIIQQMPTDVS